MATSDSSARSAVIPIDSSRSFTPRRLIADLLRTRYCIPGSILLVESIETHVPVSKRYRTVRLLLGDGELCIQALLRPEVHRFVDSGQVYVGCYVGLNKCEVKSTLLGRDPACEVDGLQGPEEMVFLVARDLTIVGWNTTYMQMAGTKVCLDETLGVKPQTSSQRLDARAERPQQPLQLLVVAEPAAQDGMAITEEKTVESCDEAEAPHQHLTDTNWSRTASNSLDWTSDDLSKPMKLTPLKSIPNLPYKQNWVVNILAIVATLSEVEAATLPPFKQRTARLTDPSTNKQVLLTVFLDPDDFAPAVGSAVLLLGVKNHRFDGGSLKKYGNEKLKEGSNWWYENPRSIEWCDVEGMKQWWAQSSQ